MTGVIVGYERTGRRKREARRKGSMVINFQNDSKCDGNVEFIPDFLDFCIEKSGILGKSGAAPTWF